MEDKIVTSFDAANETQPKFNALGVALRRAREGKHRNRGGDIIPCHGAECNNWDCALLRAYDDAGFHWKHNTFWKRLDNGSVRVRHFMEWNYCPNWVDWIIPAAEWASIVCSVSRDGETAERWDHAQDFHGR